MTKTTFADLLPYLELYDEDDGYSQFEPKEDIQICVREYRDVVEVGTITVIGDKVSFRNIGDGECGTTTVNEIECAVFEVKRTRVI